MGEGRGGRWLVGRGRVRRAGRAHFVRPESCDSPSSPEPSASWFGEGEYGAVVSSSRSFSGGWLRKLDFGVISATKVNEVVHVEGVDHGGVGFFGRNQVQVVIDAAATHTAGLRGCQCLDDFQGRKFNHGDAWQNGFREHPNGEIGSDSDTEFSAGEGREGFEQRVGVDAIAAFQQPGEALGVLEFIGGERGDENRAIEQRIHRDRSANASRSARTAAAASIGILCLGITRAPCSITPSETTGGSGQISMRFGLTSALT